MVNILIFFASLISVAVVFLGWTVFKRNKKNLTNLSFFVFSIFASLWMMAVFLENIMIDPVLAEIFLRFDFFFGSLGIFSAFVFLFNFPRPQKGFNNFVPIFLIPTLFISLFSFSDELINNVGLEASGIVFSFGPLFIFYAILLIAQIFSGVIRQIILYFKVDGVSKMQIKYVFFGFFIVAAVTVSSLFFQSSVSSDIFLLVNFSPLFLFVSIFYAIIRYHLMDIRFIIRLGAIFSFLLAVIVSIYSVLGNLFSEYLLIGKPWNYVIPSVIIVFSFGKLKEWIEVVSDKIFFQKKYRFVDVSAEVEKVIRLAGLDLEKSLSGINEILSSVLKLSASVIFVSNPEYGFLPRHIAGDKKKIKINSSVKTIFSYLLENKNRMIDREEISSDFSEHDDLGEWRNDLIKIMKDSGIAFLSPIEFQGKLIGVLALSDKRSNDYFSHEDFKLIKHISWQLSFAINNAQVYEELKKLDEEKSRFISVVSHQFRTPLTASRFNMELCLDGSINKKERDLALKDAYNGILSISNQLDKLLLVLEIEGGKLKPNFEEIDGGQIAVAVADKARHLAEEKSMSLKVDIENDNLAFFGDADKITKVLHILLDNSLHYAFPGGEIKLSVGVEEQGLKRRIVFSVSDDGIGLNKENTKNITKKFYRGQDAISMSPDGIGLGLFIAKKMVIAHGGELWYETKSKKGSIFKASFPTNRNSK